MNNTLISLNGAKYIEFKVFAFEVSNFIWTNKTRIAMILLVSEVISPLKVR